MLFRVHVDSAYLTLPTAELRRQERDDTTHYVDTEASRKSRRNIKMNGNFHYRGGVKTSVIPFIIKMIQFAQKGKENFQFVVIKVTRYGMEISIHFIFFLL